MNHPELHELVDVPRERLEVEYMAWLNLDDREVQAGLARHLCAIANHVGGFVVFGIANDMRPAGPQPPRGLSLRSGQAVGNHQAVSDSGLPGRRLLGRGVRYEYNPPRRLGPVPRGGAGRYPKHPGSWPLRSSATPFVTPTHHRYLP